MKRFILVVGLLGLAVKGYCIPSPMPVTVIPSVVISSVSNAAGSAVTATIPASTNGVGAYSTGYSTYLTHLHIEAVSTGGAAGGVRLNCTTLNLSGMSFNLVPTVSTGTVALVDMAFDNPVQSTSTALASITCPANANVLWNVILNYFQAP